jgi:hypothetical protein
VTCPDRRSGRCPGSPGRSSRRRRASCRSRSAPSAPGAGAPPRSITVLKRSPGNQSRTRRSGHRERYQPDRRKRVGPGHAEEDGIRERRGHAGGPQRVVGAGPTRRERAALAAWGLATPAELRDRRLDLLQVDDGRAAVGLVRGRRAGDLEHERVAGVDAVAYQASRERLGLSRAKPWTPNGG